MCYQGYYSLRNGLAKPVASSSSIKIRGKEKFLKFQTAIPLKQCEFDGQFKFLERSKFFKNGIDWNYSHFGKLWNYNLNYFNYLLQPEMNPKKGLDLIYNFIDNFSNIQDGLEPYPISLRTINWIKFLSDQKIVDSKIDSCLYFQYRNLLKNIEYHLSGNHLLENGFSMLFGSYYFNDIKLYEKSIDILQSELDEQILYDGAHFELSPSYHQLLLFRLLDAINLLKNNHWLKNLLLDHFSFYASAMLGWLLQITYRNGEIPLVNDAVTDLAPTTGQLKDYADRLGVYPIIRPLNECGYRKFEAGDAEVFLDVGRIGPDYIPGHAHADTLSFELAIHHHRIIVDSGVSTYEKGKERTRQRGTAAHNTVQIDHADSSEVWGGFRVARRAKPIGLRVLKNDLEVAVRCAHDGYRRLPGRPVHQRTWVFKKGSLMIKDRIHGNFRSAAGRFHFSPEVRIDSDYGKTGVMTFAENRKLHWTVLKGKGSLIKSTFHPAFGVSVPSKCLDVRFKGPTSLVVFEWDS